MIPEKYRKMAVKNYFKKCDEKMKKVALRETISELQSVGLRIRSRTLLRWCHASSAANNAKPILLKQS